jgi:T-complex protein 1 subunit eta
MKVPAVMQSIVRSYREACRVAVEELRKQSVSLAGRSEDEKRNLLRKCAETSMNSKLIASEKEFFSELVVDAVSCLDESILDLAMIGIKKVTGAGLRDSILCKGVAFKKTFSYAGFEQQPKSFKNPKILLLNIELELKTERENAEIRLDDPAKYQSIVDAEWSIIFEKLDNCHKSGAHIVLSRLAIGDLATQYFADRGVFCAGRVTEEDIHRVAKATGARIQTTVNNLDIGGTLHFLTPMCSACPRCFLFCAIALQRYRQQTGTRYCRSRLHLQRCIAPLPTLSVSRACVP